MTPTAGSLDHVQLDLVDSVDKAGQLMTWLGERRSVLGVDTETGGFSFHKNRLRLVQFGDLNRGWAVPWERWGGVVTEVMTKYDGPLVLHNAPFDARFMVHNLGIAWPWHRTNDTMTASHLVHPKMPHGLKALAALLVDKKAAMAQRVLDDGMSDNHWGWDTVPIDYPPYWVYAAMDPVLTAHLWEYHLGGPVTTTYKNVYELEIGTLAALQKMMQRGARIDVEYCKRKRNELNDYALRTRQWCAQNFDIKNVGSGPQLIAAMQRLGAEMTRLTEKGAVSVDKYALQLIAHQYAGQAPAAFAEAVLNIRKVEKSVAPYLDNFIEGADSNGRLHATFWALGTRTARMSITDPGLQTLPKKDGLVRGAVVPSTYGDHPGALLTVDYAQIEMRLMAHFSQDPGLVSAFLEADATGGDFFLNLAIQIYADSEMTKKDGRRQLTKNTAYGKAYGAGVSKMAETAGVPYDVMAPVVKSFDERFPGVRAFQQLVEQRGFERLHQEGEAYVITPAGRRMPADDDKMYVLVNYLIQSHAAEILKTKIVELDQAGYGEAMILPVHDELVLDLPAEDAEEALHDVQKIMSITEGYGVPIPAEGDVLLDNWGSKYTDA